MPPLSDQAWPKVAVLGVCRVLSIMRAESNDIVDVLSRSRQSGGWSSVFQREANANQPGARATGLPTIARTSAAHLSDLNNYPNRFGCPIFPRPAGLARRCTTTGPSPTLPTARKLLQWTVCLFADQANRCHVPLDTSRRPAKIHQPIMAAIFGRL